VTHAPGTSGGGKHWRGGLDNSTPSQTPSFTDTGSAARFFQCCPSDLTCVLCGLTLDISCGIINETQLQPKEPSSCDAQSAKNSSSPSGSQASSVATSVQGKPLPPKEDKQDKSPTLASNAESSSRNTSAISEPTVVRNAGTSHSEQFAQNVKSAASLCDTCTTVIVRELVEAKTAMHNGGGLQAILDCMPVSRKCIPIQGLVCFVEKWESIDIIPTTKSLTRLFGCVHHATNDCTPKTERSAPSRFAYHAKSSRLERNMGCEGLVAKERTTQGRDIVRKIDRRDGKGKVSVNAQIRPSTNHHPTVKSLALTKYLATLCLPPKRDTPRRILVPFSGSGSEMIGCLLAGWDRVLGVENDVKRGYVTIAKARLVWWQKQIERHGLVEPGELLGEVAPTAKKRKGGFGL